MTCKTKIFWMINHINIFYDISYKFFLNAYDKIEALR